METIKERKGYLILSLLLFINLLIFYKNSGIFFIYDHNIPIDYKTKHHATKAQTP